MENFYFNWKRVIEKSNMFALHYPYFRAKDTRKFGASHLICHKCGKYGNYSFTNKMTSHFKVKLAYYEIIILIVTRVTGLERFFHLEAFITQAKICIFTVIIVWLKYLVQHFAIRYFDKCL